MKYTGFSAETHVLNITRFFSFTVWGVQFHKSMSNSLFTCCADGSVRKLDTTDIIKSSRSNHNHHDNAGVMKTVDADEFLSPSNISVNALDTAGNMLLCCNDADAVYVIDSIA